jgi:hypothetical protein
VTPLYVISFGSSGGQSFVVMASLSMATLIWFPLHNTAFDWFDFRLTGRLATTGLSVCGLCMRCHMKLQSV